jgi:hypothetical protein
MEDLFRSYWWLLFPLSWFVIGGWNSWLNYRRSRDAMDLMRHYAAQGKEPPSDLLKTFNGPIDEDSWTYSGRRRYRYGYRRNWPSRVAFFALMSAGFAWAAWSGFVGASDAFYIVAFVMGAIAVASLVSGLICNWTGQNQRDQDETRGPKP